jgi:RHS repeat-associated protein
MQGREFAGGMGYRWGFGAQETDEHMGESYAYKFRFYESRLCRFLTVDPISFQYPWNSSYAFAENKVIRCIDLEGKEAFLVGIKNNGETVISISDRTQFGIEHWSLVCEDPTICAPPNSLYGSASHFVPTVYQRARSNIGTAVSVYTFTMYRPPIVWSKTRLDFRSRLKGLRKIVLVNSWQKSYARTCKKHV